MQRRLRLRRTDDFARLRAAGRVWRHPWLVLSMTTNGLPHNRYGFVTSKQVGGAAARNRVRRVLREAVRQLHPRLRPGHDLALIARSPIVGQPSAEVWRVVETLTQRAGLLETPGEQG